MYVDHAYVMLLMHIPHPQSPGILSSTNHWSERWVRSITGVYHKHYFSLSARVRIPWPCYTQDMMLLHVITIYHLFKQNLQPVLPLLWMHNCPVGSVGCQILESRHPNPIPGSVPTGTWEVFLSRIQSLHQSLNKFVNGSICPSANQKVKNYSQ